jgi:hypothetical protein
MSTFEPIDLAKRTRVSEYHDRTHDIETALAWSGVKKVLIEARREDLFDMIQSIKVTEKYITITTQKPIVNAELKFYRENFLVKINTNLSMMTLLKREKVRLI